MAAWTLTKAAIAGEIEMLAMALTGQMQLSHRKKNIISNAINAALVDVSLDYNVERWKFLRTSTTVATVADQAYIDLSSSILNIVSGTIRIQSEKIPLLPWDIEGIHGSDPAADISGTPMYYALDPSADPNVVRLRLYPKPDAVYTIDLVAESMIDEDEITAFPVWLMGAISDKSKENSLRNLGLFAQAYEFRASYNGRMMAGKNLQSGDGPKFIPRVQAVMNTGLQSRTP